MHECTTDCREFDRNGKRIDIHICERCGLIMDYYYNGDGTVDLETGIFCPECDAEDNG